MLLAGTAFAQELQQRKPPGAADANPGMNPQEGPKKRLGLKGLTELDEPLHPEPAATDFRDDTYKLSFHVPAGWNFEKHDGVLSNFGVDVRTARRRQEVRGVAALNFNPWPVTTFSGAAFYYSVMPRSDAASCAAQATGGPMKPQKDVRIGGAPFKHGQDRHGVICTESRDEVFTSLQGKSCLRFDLVVNTFCAETSGAMEMNATQLGDMDTRLATILGSIRIDGR